MDYQSLGNIFKGLAASGSWGCFDEFNRLIPEVLSVCTVQFKAVCDGTARYDNDQLTTHHVIIEGDQVNLDPTCGAFITMNPVRSWFLHYICTTFAHACFVGLLGSVGAARRPEGTFPSHDSNGNRVRPPRVDLPCL